MESKQILLQIKYKSANVQIDSITRCTALWEVSSGNPKIKIPWNKVYKQNQIVNHFLQRNTQQKSSSFSKFVLTESRKPVISVFPIVTFSSFRYLQHNQPP